jgi:hypothetical protein
LGGAWLLFRIWYYADLLPNTFYLKDDWMPRQGWRYLLDSVNSYGFHVVLGAAWVGLLALRRVRGGAAALHLPARIVMLLLAATVALYVVKIGGDPRHYRFLAFPVVLSIASTAGLPEHMWSYGGRRIPTGLVFAGGLVLALFVATLYPRQLARHPLLGPQPDVPYHRMVDLINDAADHRRNPSLARPPWGRMRRERRRHYERARTAPATVKVGARCVDLYDAPASRVVHSLGLTDPFLARTTMRAARPAHKPGLRRLAADLADILASQPNGPSRGMLRNAVETGRAPDWVRANLDTLEVIERKAYNDHAFLENLRLALTVPPRIDPERTP